MFVCFGTPTVTYLSIDYRETGTLDIPSFSTKTRRCRATLCLYEGTVQYIGGGSIDKGHPTGRVEKSSTVEVKVSGGTQKRFGWVVRSAPSTRQEVWVRVRVEESRGPPTESEVLGAAHSSPTTSHISRSGGVKDRGSGNWTVSAGTRQRLCREEDRSDGSSPQCLSFL